MTHQHACRLALTLPLAALALAVSSAYAAPTQGPSDDSFFTAPAQTTGSHGDLISYRSTTVDLGAGAPASNAWNVLYQSKDSLDTDNVVSGTVFVPQAAWTGTGPRPVILYAIGTQGLATNCAPSRQFAQKKEYEASNIAAALKAGYAVLVTDYEGYLTGPNALTPTYLAGASQGHAVLDLFKAATSIPSVGIAANAPAAIWGYSQGGQSAGFAGELYASYTPDLKVVAVAAGGIPGDFIASARNLNGSYGFAFLASAIVGLNAQYGEDIPINLVANATGKAALEKLGTQCVFTALFDVMNKNITQYTTDSLTLDQLLAVGPVKSTLLKQSLGTKAIPVPVYAFHGAADEFIPLGQAYDLKKAWCAKGTNVTFDLYPSEHIATLTQAASPVLAWLGDRFAGKAASSTCGTTATPTSTAIAPGGNLVVDLNKWPLNANVHLKLLNSDVILPATSTFSAKADVTAKTLTGSLNVPEYIQKVNFIGLKLPIGLRITSAGNVTGSVDLDNDGILHIRGKAPVDITLTSLAGIPFGSCKTVTPVEFPLTFDGPISSLGNGNLTFTGSVTFPKVAGCPFAGTFSAFMAGPGQTYSFTVSPPAPVRY